MSDYVPCPRCGSTVVKKVSFTWWGGALGPALFCHVKCYNCGMTYNGKTGKSNNNAIIIYSVVVGIIAIAIVLALTRI